MKDGTVARIVVKRPDRNENTQAKRKRERWTSTIESLDRGQARGFIYKYSTYKERRGGE